MRRFFSRRQMLAAAATGLLGGGLRLAASDPGSPELATSPLKPGYEKLRAILLANWFTESGCLATGGRPGILPTNGDGGFATGTTRGVTNYRAEAMWQEAQFARFLANDALLSREGEANGRLRRQWALLKATYSSSELGGDGTDGAVNASDDGGWKMQYLQSLHQITGDHAILVAMENGLIALLDRYRDTYNGGDNIVANSPCPFSRYGILYALPGQDPNGQGRSTTYEAGLMLASLYLYSHNHDDAFLTYTSVVYRAFRDKLRHPSGIYYQSLQLDPKGEHDRTPYLQPIEVYRGLPKQGWTGFSLGGTSAMALLGARLYRVTGDERYRQDVAQTVRGMTQLQIQNLCLLNDRDPWTNGFYFYDFAREVLPLPGVDDNGVMRKALTATAHRILDHCAIYDPATRRTGYSADWSGSTDRTIDQKYASWTEASRAANGGRGGGGGGPDQIMTQANTGIMVQAALALDA